MTWVLSAVNAFIWIVIIAFLTDASSNVLLVIWVCTFFITYATVALMQVTKRGK